MCSVKGSEGHLRLTHNVLAPALRDAPSVCIWVPLGQKRMYCNVEPTAGLMASHCRNLRMTPTTTVPESAFLEAIAHEVTARTAFAYATLLTSVPVFTRDFRRPGGGRLCQPAICGHSAPYW